MKNKIYPLGVCLLCSVSFDKKRKDQKYCSSTCKTHYWEKSHPRSKQQNGVYTIQLTKEELELIIREIKDNVFSSETFSLVPVSIRISKLVTKLQEIIK